MERAGVSELLSVLVIVALVIALSSFILTQARPISPKTESIVLKNSYIVRGSPSLYFLQLNLSSPSQLKEFSIDTASSGNGVIALRGDSYFNTDKLCIADSVTFFSIKIQNKSLIDVSSDGNVWIDGVSTYSRFLDKGYHSIVISNGSYCNITLAGFKFSMEDISMIPEYSISPISHMLIIPFYQLHHRVNVMYEWGMVDIDI